ncbi:MAG: hypothetical protein FJX78_03040 [Armatimonadetes bacterium]|nr:hypothetical protein [Armatimonadota bacterium]
MNVATRSTPPRFGARAPRRRGAEGDEANEQGTGRLRVAARANGDYSDLAAEFAATKPDLFFLAEHETVANRLAVAMRNAGVMVPFFGPNVLKPFPHLATFDFSVEGPYYTNVIGDAGVKPAIAAMADRYQDKFREAPTLYAAEAYDAAGVILDALRRASPNLAREATLRAIAATRDYSGITGPVTFDAHGDALVREIGIYKVENKERTFLGFVNDLLAAAPRR